MGPTHRRSPEGSDPERQEVDGGARAESESLTGTEFPFGKMESSGEDGGDGRTQCDCA